METCPHGCAATGRPGPGVAVPGPAALNSSDAVSPCRGSPPGTAAGSSRRAGRRCRGLRCRSPAAAGPSLRGPQRRSRAPGAARPPCRRGAGGGGWAVHPPLPGTALAQRRDAPGQSLFLLPAVSPPTPSFHGMCLHVGVSKRHPRAFEKPLVPRKCKKTTAQKVLGMPCPWLHRRVETEYCPDKLSQSMASVVALMISHCPLSPSVLLPVMRPVPMRWTLPCQQ